MRKLSNPMASIAFGVLLLGAIPATAGGGGVAIYERTYYSDASHQTQVGSRYFRECRIGPGGDIVVYDKEGSQTAYYTQVLAGYCMDGEYFDP
ncbi:MAG TPA: hypothetical protein VF619_10510 [Allosphingosinicella sp.]|jgi:hypothetical protein